MTVGELIEKLSQVDQSLPVVVYCDESEDGGLAYGIEVAVSGDSSEPYYKADSPYYDKNGVKHVIIR